MPTPDDRVMARVNDIAFWCVRCEDIIPSGLIELAETPMPHGVYGMESGVLAVRDGAILYCLRCVAMGVVVCAGCGCTDEAACPGGCFWAAPGWCSRCAWNRSKDKTDAKP